MKTPTNILCRKGFCDPRDIIAYAVWAYHRFALSTADVVDLLGERGVIARREMIRLWVNRFGTHLAIAPVGAVHGQTTGGIWTKWSSQTDQNTGPGR
jgi:hypothetical protein